jgi:chloride channel protein, CIC family
MGTDDGPGPARGRAAVHRMVEREVRDFVRTHEQRRRQLPRAIVIGLLAGLLAVAFRGSLDAIEPVRSALIGMARAHAPWGPLAVVVAAAVTGGFAVWLVAAVAPEAAGSGIPHVKAVLHGLEPIRWRRLLPAKFASGVLGIGAGLALGREGPTIQMGAGVGEMVGGWFASTPRERRTLIAAGAGAGLSAAFNAPLAGLVFVLEEVQRDFAPAVFAMALLASVVADVTTRLVLGQLPVFHVTVESIPPLATLPISLVVGVFAGLLGVVFNRSLVGSLDLFQRLVPGRAWLRGVAVGGAVGAVGCVLPDVLGTGKPLLAATLDGTVQVTLLPFWFVLRFVLTMASYGCGAAGGIFSPLLVLGAAIGRAVGDAAHGLVPGTVDQATTFAVVGMAAYFSAIVRAPLTGIVLMVEMTGNYSLVLPLLAASLTAYGVADLLGDRPIYEALLERDLLRSHAEPSLGRTLLLDLTVTPDAPFEGKAVRDLGLPPGCILILLRRGTTEEVPTADSRLAAGDRITALVAPGAEHAIPMLRDGTSA